MSTETTGATDNTPPVFSNLVPIAGISALNSNRLAFTLTDPQGSNGTTPSGVDPATVTPTLANGATLTLTATGLNYTGSLSTVNDRCVHGAADMSGPYGLSKPMAPLARATVVSASSTRSGRVLESSLPG